MFGIIVLLLVTEKVMVRWLHFEHGLHSALHRTTAHTALNQRPSGTPRQGASAVSTIEAAVAPGVEWIGTRNTAPPFPPPSRLATAPRNPLGRSPPSLPSPAGRWLPTFFCPSLVVLPLTIRALPGDAVAKLCGITLGGWLLSICFAAAATVTIRKFTKTTFQPSPPGKKPPGFSDLHRKGWAITAAASLALAAAGPPEAAAIAGKVFMMAGAFVLPNSGHTRPTHLAALRLLRHATSGATRRSAARAD